jgi:DNA-binding GntR family transcriptional regulator
MVRDLYNVRAVLEGYATRLAVANCTGEDLEHFCDLIESMRKAAHEGDASGVVANDFAVHTYIVKLSGNMILEQIWSTLQVQVRRILSQRHRGYHDLEEIADSHIALLELFRQGDADGADEFIQAHILDAGRDLLERWNGEPK